MFKKEGIMSKKGWRWFDRLFIFGALATGFAIVVNTSREYLMEKGYLLPEEQKKHLSHGAGYVREKFDNAQITAPTYDTIRKINAAQNQGGNAPQNKKTKKFNFSERVADPLKYNRRSSPLGNPLKDGHTFLRKEGVNSEKAMTPDKDAKPIVRIAQNNINKRITFLSKEQKELS